MEPQIDYKQLAAALLSGVGEKAVSSTPTTTFGHGPGGLFSYPGLSRPVFSAMLLPHLGLQNVLPVRSSMDANPLYGIFTGVTATSGSEPTGVCDDPPTVGLSKLCTHSFVYGRQARQTRVFDLDRMGLWTNRGEFGDLQFLGNPFQAANPNIPTMPDAGGMNGVLRNEIGKALFEFGVGWARDFAREIYTGNPANNTAGGGRKYYNGLDILVNTGYRDAITGQACPAADSIVYDFNSLAVESNGSTYVRRITNIWRRLRYIAAETGLDPVRFALVMRWSLFYELTEIWPCAYSTYRCQNAGTFSASQTQVTDTRFLMEMRDGMRGDQFNRTGQYLLIDGERVPVILDDSITETVLAGESFTSSIYLVPLTVMGGTPVLFMEHINYDAPGAAMEAARVFAPDGMFMASDSGRFLWHKKVPTNFCVQLMAKTEPRLILLTPQLAARMTNVKYTPVAHERDWDTASSYFYDGGKTDYGGYGPSFYTPTA